MSVPLPNLYVEALSPNVMVFGDGNCGKKLGLDEVTGGAILMGLVPL